MSTTARKTWLVAYDIADPARLARVHRILKRCAAPVQYSAFTLEAHTLELADLLTDLEAVIDTNADDVRAYHLPEHCKVWSVGATELPDGVEVDADLAATLLLARSGQAIKPCEDP